MNGHKHISLINYKCIFDQCYKYHSLFIADHLWFLSAETTSAKFYRINNSHGMYGLCLFPHVHVYSYNMKKYLQVLR